MKSIIPRGDRSPRKAVRVSTRRRSGAARRPEPLKGALAGFVGGIAGTLAMDTTLWLWTLLDLDHEGPRGAIERALRLHHTGIFGQSEPRAHHFAEDTPSERLAKMFLKKIGLPRNVLRDLQRPGGTVVHYGFGSTVGAIYGLLAEFSPAVTRGKGIPFGTAVLIAADEIGLPATGLARSPFETRPSAHAYAAVGHFAYGFVTELVRSAIRGKSGRFQRN